MQSIDDTSDPFELARFVTAQESSYADALAELGRGRKRSHWMWYVFPQVAGLGHSAMAVRYAIGSRAEAEAYLVHPLLGQRLRRAAEVLLTVQGSTATEIMGTPDDVKLRSSMTLFAQCSPADSVFHRVLVRFFAGEPDPRTLEILNAAERKSS